MAKKEKAYILQVSDAPCGTWINYDSWLLRPSVSVATESAKMFYLTAEHTPSLPAPRCWRVIRTTRDGRATFKETIFTFALAERDFYTSERSPALV